MIGFGMMQLLVACLLWTVALANVEKVIFSAPPSISQPKLHVSKLAGTLSPANLRTRTELPIAFPTEESPRGIESWVKLEDLNPGARYEVRICWLATTPSDWWLHTFTTSDVASGAVSHKLTITETSESTESSTMLLRISGIAAYYTTDKELMDNPAPVLVDIILDEYLFGVLPRSLVGTVAFIIPVFAIAIFMGNFAVKSLYTFAAGDRKVKDA